MPVVSLTLPGHSYRILVEPGALARLGTELRAVAPHAKAGLVVDTGVALHAAVAHASLVAAGYAVAQVDYPATEANKSLPAVGRILDVLLEKRLERKSPVIALGGGITGDVTGFCSASLLRGTPFVQCPTTLLSMVDASVGGKTGVNTAMGKNLVGAFHQPVLVVCDIAVLDTLPRRELVGGLAECVKHAVIRDQALFDWMEQNAALILARDHAVLTELVARNVAIKAQVVEADEKEDGERAHLNFGHTFGHAIEKVADFDGSISHGEAVALGMRCAAWLAEVEGRCPVGLERRLTGLLAALGLPTHLPRPLDRAALLDAMGSDKKVKDGRVRLVLPQEMGRVEIVNDAAPQRVAEAWGVVG